MATEDTEDAEGSEVAVIAEVAGVVEATEVCEVAFGQEALLEEELVAAEFPKVQADGGHRLALH